MFNHENVMKISQSDSLFKISILVTKYFLFSFLKIKETSETTYKVCWTVE